MTIHFFKFFTLPFYISDFMMKKKEIFMKIESISDEVASVKASEQFCKNAWLNNQEFYHVAQTNRMAFWNERAQALRWHKKWHQTCEWKRPFAQWFVGGCLNAAENCLDVHLPKKASKPAIIWEGEKGESRTLSYLELTEGVNQVAHVLQSDFKLKKGDRVTIYMPMLPELVMAVLACARLGLIHSVVFAGFSAKSLHERISDSGSKVIITANAAWRRGKLLHLKKTVDEALAMGKTPIESTLVLNHVKNEDHEMQVGRDFDFEDLVACKNKTIDSVYCDSEDILFILYTSGTTGKPKGIMHSTGGYLTHAKYSCKAVFDLKDDDVYWCTADVGWITGHSYLVYGPLSNGATIFMYEGSPDYPHKARFWELIDKYQVSILYTAPTAIRAFMQWGDDYLQGYDLGSLRLLGSVGEPINPEAWQWYYSKIGKEKCPIVDTWWQTETGGIMISNLPALNDMKPGMAGLPLPGIKAEILNHDGNIISEGAGLLSLTEPWPSMLRGIWGDENRYIETYWSRFESYFAGDAATRDQEAYIKVLGRVDDVLNVSGHRIGTMEIESALVAHEAVSEAAVVGMSDSIKGQAIVAFVTLTQGYQCSESNLREFVAKDIGAIAKPKHIIFTVDLPKTRSGKIMRRILKALVLENDLGDCSTLANPEVIETIKKEFNKTLIHSS